MLKHQLLHPEISAVLARAGHSAKILIADGNYPASSTLGPSANLISLNLAPGVVSCTQVLEALVTAIPIEAANTMQPESSGPYAMKTDPPIWTEFRNIFQAAGTRCNCNRSSVGISTLPCNHRRMCLQSKRPTSGCSPTCC